MKSVRQKKGLTSTPGNIAELPPAVRDYLQKFRAWEESFRSPARRQAYIKQVCQRIAERFQPEKIILFGSHAYSQPTSESEGCECTWM